MMVPDISNAVRAVARGVPLSQPHRKTLEGSCEDYEGHTLTELGV